MHSPQNCPRTGIARRRRVLLPLAALLVASVAAGAWRMAAARRAGPLRAAYWYWHHPFRLSTPEQAGLHAAGIDRLYVHAGTLVEDGRGGLRLTSRQRWPAAPYGPTWAVLRVHPRALPALLQSQAPERATALIREAALPRYVEGVQWDVDVPTQRLPDYARFLAATRSRLRSLDGGALAQGVTALPDWLRVPDYRRVCDAVDEIAPQFYGNRWPEAGRQPPALWEFESMLRSAGTGSGRARTWIGLPAYGRCFLLDRSGRAAGVRHDIDPELPLDDPAWRLAHSETRAASFPGTKERIPYEDSLALTCDEAAPAGPIFLPPGTTLWFQWPRESALLRSVQRLRAAALPQVEGVCFFRWPAPGEPLALPPVTLNPAAAGDQPLRPEIRPGPGGVEVRVINRGADAPPAGEPVELTVFPGGGELTSTALPRWQLGTQPVSVLRADRALLSRPLLRPGHEWSACRVAGATRSVRAEVRWRAEDGTTRTTSAEWLPSGMSSVPATASRHLPGGLP